MRSGNHGNVIEINLRDLVFDLLYRWRSLLSAVLIGALLMGGYAVVSNRKTESVRQEAEAAAILRKEQAEIKLAERKRQAEEEYQAEIERLAQTNQGAAAVRNRYTGLYNAGTDYLESSVLMSIDPYHEWQARAVYAVIPETLTEGSGDAARVEQAAIAEGYISAVFSDWSIEKLIEIYGEKSAAYAAELFRCAVTGASGSFTLTAIGPSEELAKAGLKYMETAVNAFSEKEGRQLKAHHLVLLNEYALQVVDTETEAYQRNMLSLRETYQNGITSNADLAVSPPAVQPEPEPEPEKLPEMKSVVGMAVIGGLAGLLVLLFFYFLRYVLCGKLQRSEWIRELGVPVYGEMNHSRARRPGKGLDKLLERQEFGKNYADRETVISNICALLEEQAGKGLLLTGTLPEAKMQSFLQEIRGKLQADCAVGAEGDLLNNRRAVEAAHQAKAVVLVEEKYVSDLKNIDRAAEVLSVCEKPVIGAVIL